MKQVGMIRERFTTEKIIWMLVDAEFAFAQGMKVCEICRSHGLPEQNHYRWRGDYRRLKTTYAKLF